MTKSKNLYEILYKSKRRERKEARQRKRGARKRGARKRGARKRGARKSLKKIDINRDGKNKPGVLFNLILPLKPLTKL